MTAAEVKAAKDELEAEFEREDFARLLGDLRDVLATEAGRSFLSAVVREGCVFGQIFEKSAGDSVRLAYETGRRECAAWIYLVANMAAPELVLQSFIESNTLSAERKIRMKAIENELDADEQLERTDK